jgi:mono/diheme cytochrome c family protein
MSWRHTLALVLPAVILGFALQSQGRPVAPPSDPPAFVKDVRPVFRQYCISCHAGASPAARLDLAKLAADFKNPRTRELWKEVVNVMNQRQMPPKGHPQPPQPKINALVTAIEKELAASELAQRSTEVVMRRLNRNEYNNTMRDLLGVDLDPASRFPEDGASGGFDNVGKALTLSPLQVELYYATARELLDKILVEGPEPPKVKWHFEPEENKQGMDAHRVQRGEFRDIILNDGNNPTENGFTVIHRASWDKNVDFRNFRFPYEGEYIIRFRAASRVPNRAEVTASAERILIERRDRQTKENPAWTKGYQEEFDRDFDHFKTHRMYNYGPARVKIVKHLGSAPSLVNEMDVDATPANPKVFEVRDWFTTQQTGVDFVYAYSVPSTPENWWMQGNEAFARPQLMIDWIEVEGPVLPSWPPPAHRRILFDSPNKGTNDTAYAREVIARFMGRAFRRPVTTEEVNARLRRYIEARTDGLPFLEAIKIPLASVLASPHFLFLVEGDSGKLSPHELAQRLSYFLWSSMPDAELRKAADDGSLTKPAVQRAQVERMLKDPKAQALVENFAGQWLGLRRVGANPPVPNLYPEYDRHLETSIVAETQGFFKEILRSDADARSFIRSDFVTINERLARYYGIPGVKGDQIRRVPVPNGVQRGGLLTQASILSITSNGTRTSPVVRGVWVLRTMLGADPGLPVANVGEIPNKVPGVDKATVRARLEIHRQNPACARCHDNIDPIGLSLENFNAAGEYREQEGHGWNGKIERDDPKIDASAQMPDGTKFVGVSGLQDQLLKRQDAFLENLASHLTTYALGRELGFADKPAVRAHLARMKQEKYTLRSLIHSIVSSNAFQSR